MIKVISLGWGIQSFTLVAMSALGELDKVDFAIHSDTTHEKSGTYNYAKKYTSWIEDHGIKVVTVKPLHMMGEVGTWGGIFIPAFTDSPDYSGCLRGGMLRRQCTQRWKIAPIRRYLQNIREKENVGRVSLNVKYWGKISSSYWRVSCSKNSCLFGRGHFGL